jgi:putative DNA primase/helicase
MGDIKLNAEFFDYEPNEQFSDPVVSARTPLDALTDGEEALLRAAPTQDNCALIFVSHYAGKMVFAHRFGKWYEWDGKRWAQEKTDRAFNLCRLIARKTNIRGKAAYATAYFARGVESFAKADPAIAVTGEEFDADNYLLNTPGFVIDLRTNTHRPSKQDDWLTKITPVTPASIGGDRFLNFMDEITGGDKELLEFLQVSLGACLSGAVESHWISFWTGSGRNGKNTLGDTVQYVMGDYAKKIPASVLMSKSHESHPTEVAQLAGARLVTSSEIDDGAFLHESRLNELTGDAMVSARFMRQDFFQFKRTHKHLIYGNHRPQIRSATEALKARIKIVPFRQSFIGREDPNLPSKLHDESGFILGWLIEGHKKWIDAGRSLPRCQAVEDESKDYFESQSTIDNWIFERCELVENVEVGASRLPKSRELYENYRDWKHERGESPISETRFSENMSKQFKKERSNGSRFRGIRLLSALER